LLVAGDCCHFGKSFDVRLIARAVARSCAGVAAPAEGASPSGAMLAHTTVIVKAQVSKPLFLIGFLAFHTAGRIFLASFSTLVRGTTA